MTGFFHDQLQQRLQQVQREAEAARLSPDAGALHRLRVAIRRLTEAVRVVETGRRWRRRLRPAMRAAGEARNLDVAIALCGKSGVPGAEAVVAALRQERSRAAQRFVRRLIELDAGALALPRVMKAPPDAAVLLRRLSARYWAAGKQALGGGARALHQFRLQTKHLRYTLELLPPLLGRGAAARLELLRSLQGHLGDLNDCKTARSLAAVRECHELEQWLAQRQRKARRRFEELWAEAWRRTGGGRTWDRYFAARAVVDVVPGARVLLE